MVAFDLVSIVKRWEIKKINKNTIFPLCGSASNNFVAKDSFFKNDEGKYRNFHNTEKSFRCITYLWLYQKLVATSGVFWLSRSININFVPISLPSQIMLEGGGSLY